MGYCEDKQIWATREEYEALLKRVEALEGKVKRKTKIPERMVPTNAHFDYAGINQLSIGNELEAFRLYHEAKGTLSGNWNASFSTWLRNAVKFNKHCFADKKQDDADRVLGRGIYDQGMNLNIRGSHGSLT
jgi:hypothetical protein